MFPNGCVPEAVSFLVRTPAENLVGQWKRTGIYTERHGTDWHSFLVWAGKRGMVHRPLDIPFTLDELSEWSAKRQETCLASTKDHAFVMLRGLPVDNGGLQNTEVIRELLQVPDPGRRRRSASAKARKVWDDITRGHPWDHLDLCWRPGLNLLRLSRQSSDRLETYLVLTEHECFEMHRGIVQGYADVSPEDKVLCYTLVG